MNTTTIPHPHRRRAKRAARKLAKLHPARVHQQVQAQNARDRALTAGRAAAGRLIAMVASAPDIEPPEGYVERAVARARAEGVIP